MKIVFLIFVFFINMFNLSAQEIDYTILKKEFIADIVRVEKACRDSQDLDYSTLGIIHALNECEKGYDVLLNKYYKMLYNSLNNEGQKALIQSQRNWIKLRDSEKVLVGQLGSNAYDRVGGGTVWGVVVADARSDITSRRVFELYNYITFADIAGKSVLDYNILIKLMKKRDIFLLR